MDKNYWKEAYKEYWEISSKKEIFVKELIESKTGFKTLEVGLGAGSEDFLSGSARLWFNKRRRRFICNRPRYVCRSYRS